MLRVDDIRVYRDQTYVLQGVSLDVGRGEIVALIGANGAGKTSMLRTISGLLRPKSGRILYKPDGDGDAINISRISAEQIVALGISHCPEGRGIFSQLSVRENLVIGAYLRKNKQAIEQDYRRICGIFPILGERAGQTAGSLSGGEQEMLAVGRALMSRPRLLILDEPSLGLGPIVIENLFDVLHRSLSSRLLLLPRLRWREIPTEGQSGTVPVPPSTGHMCGLFHGRGLYSTR